MFKALMRVQWKGSRGTVVLGAILGFTIPLASINLGSDPLHPGEVVARMQEFGIAYALLAGGVGLALALFAWSADHRGRHVYALSLPVDRSRYAAMRFGAGALFLLLPALGVLVGSLVAVAIASVPAGLHGYPVSLALRFLLASAVAFSLFFAVASATPRAAGMVLGGIASLLIVSFILSLTTTEFDLLGTTVEFLLGPGPLGVFTGRWMLIDA